MQQILAVWASLDLRRRIVVVLSAITMLLVILWLSKMANMPTMSLLYSGLESGPAGEVVQALEQTDVAYEIRGNAIFVEANRRDELRMTLASDGLPTNTSQGYELLDTLSGFGTTSQMFDAAYWRAKEGELARTIVASPHIRSARVHIANLDTKTFARQQRATASVTVSTVEGNLSATHARALKYLVSSAVSGLLPEDVAIIDGRGGLVQSGDEAIAGPQGSDDRAEELRKNVERILEARVGYGNAVVEVSIDTVTDREQITERTFDPESRVAISSETEERSNTSSDTSAGDVTVASNLPDGGSAAGNDSKSQNSETRERINYEVSETTREVLRNPGAIKRLSVAVLLDGIRSTNAETGATEWIARSAEEMSALRELVMSAVGYDDARGDQITIQSLEFEPLIAVGTDANAPSMAAMLNLDVMRLIQLGVLSLVVLILGLFVLRPLLAAKPSNTTPALPRPASARLDDSLPLAGSSSADQWDRLPALNGEITDDEFSAPNMAVVSDFPMGDDAQLPSLGNPGGETPVERLRHLINERQDETVEILRSWMEDSEERV